MNRMIRSAFIAVATLSCIALAAERMTPGGKWKANSMDRPRPAVVDPGTASTPDKPGQPPSDAIILFNGKDLSQWEQDGQGQDKGKRVAPTWKVENGYMETVPKSGTLRARQSFSDCQLHIEWATPAEIKGSSQGRGNSGILLGGGQDRKSVV